MKSDFTKFFSSLLLFLMFFADNLHGQLPGWVLTRDNDGNRYYIDKRGKIWTSGEPEFKLKPVTLAGIDYYLTQGIELIKNRHIPEGLTILNSIIAMPSNNEKMHRAQAEATNEIRKLKKSIGNRFNLHLEKAPLSIFKHNDIIHVENHFSGYRLIMPCEVNILHSKVRKKHNYRYHGLLAGLNFKQDNNRKNGYDGLLALDSERFKSVLTSVNELKNHWELTLGKDVFIRRELEKQKHFAIYSIENSSHPAFSGYEGYYIRGNKGCFLRIIFSPALGQSKKNVILNIVKNFKY